MQRLHKQMKELVQCQGKQTKEFVENKLKNFMDADDINVSELQETLRVIKEAIASDENTFKLVNGMIETNKSKLFNINNTIVEIQGSIQTLNDDNIILNRKIKECLRVQEEDMVLNVSELCAIFDNALNDIEVDETL